MQSSFSAVVVCVLLTGAESYAADSKETELANKAQAIFQTHCYRCHGQQGVAEGGFNYVLDFPKLAGRKKVVPGNPGRSKLYTRMVNADDPMPPLETKERPSKEEIAIVREWIERGAPDYRTTSTVRAFITADEIARAIRTDLEQTSGRDQIFTRYFTITHLANAGLSDDELQTYRVGLSKLVNSLSWGRRVVAPRPIDSKQTILRIDLRDYQWDERVWDAILAHDPYGVSADDKAMEYCQSATRCRVPLVRADWFVSAASRPPLYHQVLQLPATEHELENKLGVDVPSDIRQERVVRAGFNSSGVSRNNRLIERHESGHSVYWKSYDFASNTGRQNLFAHPLGPGTQLTAFQHDGGEIIFNLPNGLQAYMLVDGEGRRIDKGPTAIVSDPSRPDRAVVNGLSCMSCHARGLIDKADQVREHVSKNASAYSAEERMSILALFPPRDRFLALLQEDARRFQEAVAKTGAPLSATEPVTSLALRFEAELDLALAAAEAGVQPEDLLKTLGRSTSLAKQLGSLKIEGGTVQRQVFVDSFRDLIHEIKRGKYLEHGNKVYAKWILEGDVLREKGDRLQAIKAYSEAIAIAPDNPLAYVDRGDAHREQDDLPRSLADYDQALRLDPRFAVAYNNRGLVYFRMGDHARAIADCTEALRLDPAFAAAYHNRAAAQFGKGNIEESIADYSAGLQLDPRSAVAWNNRGYALIEKGDDQRALADFDEAIRLRPNFVAALNNRGLAQSRLGRYDQAIADFTEAVRIDAKFAKAYFNRGIAYEKKGKVALAQADRRQAILLDPSLDKDD